MPATTRTRWTGFPILFGLFIALIAITAWEAASSHAGYDITMETDSQTGQVHSIRMRDGRWRLEIEYRGEIEMTPDERALERLGPDAYLEIEERDGRERRRFEAVPGAGGVPEITWLVDRQPAAFDAEARVWLARVLKRVYRATGHDAEGRVGRLLAAGGVAGVLDEISKIGSDRVARIYFERLLAQAELEDGELARALRQMAREIGSDHELRQLMPAIPAAAPGNPATAEAWLAAARTIGSDHELRQTLSHFLGRPDFDAAGCETLLDAASEIGSDFDLAELLVEVVGWVPESRALPDGYFRALSTIGSDFELRRALGAAVSGPGLDDETVSALLEAALDIGSDHEQAELLLQLAGAHQVDGEVRHSFDRALATIGSDHQRERVLAAVGD